MPSGLPARVVVVCTLVFGVAIAHAERREVAIIDLAGDPATVQLAEALNPVLLGHPDLQPIRDAALVVELYGPFRDDDQEAIVTAANRKRAAETSLGSYSFEAAYVSARSGEGDLENLTPTPSVIALYAQLSFITGQALLGMPRQVAEAPLAFALAHRLDPTFVPDPARYLPDVVQAFEAAQRQWSGKVTLTVAGTGRLWIDGTPRGTAPADVEVDAGPHVVWLTGPDRVTSGKEILVEGKQAKVEIPDAPASKELKVRRARAALRNAPDPAARAAAMKQLAELVGVRDAVLLTSANDKIVVQTWNAGTRDQAPGFSALRELKHEKASDLLTPLAPPKPKLDLEPVIPMKPLVDKRRWYERRTWQASIVVGVIAAFVSGYYLYKGATDSSILVDNNPTFDSTNPTFDSRVRW